MVGLKTMYNMYPEAQLGLEDLHLTYLPEMVASDEKVYSRNEFPQQWLDGEVRPFSGSQSGVSPLLNFSFELSESRASNF